MRKKENRESIQKGKDGKESRKTYKKSMLAAGFLAVGMFMGSTEVLAMPQEGEEWVAYAKVNTCLNIRTGAGTEYGVSAQLPKEGCCKVLEDAGDWCRIISDGIEGYVFKDYLITGVTQKEYLALTQKKEPVYAYRISRQATDGQQAEAQAAKTSAEISGKGEMVAAYALQFVGNPYVWGGTSLTNGADCSGFVQSVYQNFGVSLPRVAADQAQAGTKIAVEEAQPGDLIFYADGGSIYHVVLYIGNGQVVHASSAATGIKVSNVYWENAVWAVRVLSGS